jgi:tight adherence protein B
LAELWLIYIIIFGAVVLAVQGAYWIYAEQHKTREAVNRRLVVAKRQSSGQETLEALKRERGLVGVGSPYLAPFNTLVVQSGLRIDAKLWIGVAFLLGLSVFLLLGLALGFGLISFILALIISSSLLLLGLVVIRQKRIARLSNQLPDALDVLVRGVKAGYPFTVALNLVGKEMPDPIGTEFGMTSDEINFGSTLDVALDNLNRRVGLEELLYVAMAVKIQNETGGNLAEILSRLSRLIRDRMMLHLKVKALSAEGRLSAIVLSIFPFALFGIINLIRPDFYNNPIVRNSAATMPALIIGLILLVIGNFMIFRMVNFKV